MDTLEALKKFYGYSSFREGQKNLIEHILSGQNTLGIMPTGAGKSVCYQIPAFIMDGITLVISPLISLMKDQVGALNQAGVHAAYINSSLTQHQIQLALSYAKAGRYKIIYAAPERLLTAEFLDFACTADISMVTIDEAHCISQWGQDFRPGYLKISEFIHMLPIQPVISAFTATATKEVKEDIIRLLEMKEPFVLTTGFDRPNLYFSVRHPKDRFAETMGYIRKYKNCSGIIYCLTRKTVEQVCEKLNKEGIPATRYHAGLSDSERQKNQDDFIYDTTPIMVATNAFGMGIDKSNVRFVLHYNMPKNMESYYQEAGRAGRDGENAECILLYNGQDIVLNQYFIENNRENDEACAGQEQIKQKDRERLKQMVLYCQTKECLRNYILSYFGESPQKDCCNCSNCDTQFQEKDVTDISRSILSCIRDTKQHFGMQMILMILMGSNSAKLDQYHLSEQHTYGILKEQNKAFVSQVIYYLREQGYLMSADSQYPVLMLTEKSSDILASGQSVIMKIAEEAAEKSSEKQLHEFYQLTQSGQEVFESLRKLRYEIANREKLPPYLVFSDKTLKEMCRILPESKEEMMQVSGVGETKYQHYGELFLETIVRAKGIYGSETIETPDATQKVYQITDEMKKNMICEEECYISDLIRKFNEVTMAGTSSSVIKRAAITQITDWLVEEGYLKEIYDAATTKKSKIPTEAGNRAGISARPKMAKNNKEYLQVYYNTDAQKLVLDHLCQIQTV